MNKQETLQFLQDSGIRFELTEHKAVYHMGELSAAAIPYPEADAKNLFIRDDKKQNYYLLTVKGDKRADLKAFRKANDTRPLCFASEEDLLRLMGLTPGSVTPLGILNDEGRTVKVFLDRAFFDEPHLIGVHPNDNTATVWMKTEDLVNLIRAHGNELFVAEIQERTL